MNEMNQMHDMPDELFGLMGKKKFDELDARQQEMVLQWFTEDEFNQATSLLEESQAIFRSDELLLAPDPAIAATLSTRMRNRHRKPLLMRMIPVWQAAAMLLLAVGLGYRMVHTLPPKTLALRDTVYITKDVPVTHTVYDTVFITRKAPQKTPAHAMVPKQPAGVTQVTNNTAGATDTYPLHMLEVDEITDPHNAVSVNNMAEDPLVQTFGFRRF